MKFKKDFSNPKNDLFGYILGGKIERNSDNISNKVLLKCKDEVKEMIRDQILIDDDLMKDLDN